ncbi:MAG: flagellar protein FlgN [Ignavibacteriales bacterium]|nr:MAG: flagellar protein FlgN [Ignavibacteriales bacterium]
MNELLNSLTEQQSNLQEFLGVVQKQQRALVENNLTSLEESISLEEKVLQKIEMTEKNREEIMKNLSSAYSIKIKSLSVSDFLKQIGNVNHPLVQKITELSDAIKTVITDITKVNYQNKQLINHSRNFIKETVNLVFGTSGSQLLDKRM